MLTASIFRWTDTCDRCVWRDIHLDRALRDEPSVYRATALNAGIQHEEKIHQITAPSRQTVIVRSWAEGVNLTLQDMRDHVGVITGAFLEIEMPSPVSQQSIKLGGRVDRLELQPNGLYCPIEIKRYTQTNEDDELQLSFYVWMLCRLQHVDILPATFWLGKNDNGTPKHIVSFEYDRSAFEDQLFSTLEVINGQEPEVKLIPECHRCHWYSSCFPDAIGKKHVSLLSGLRTTTQEDFAEAGIQTLDQIVAMKPEDLRAFRGIKTTAHGFHASARAWVEEKPIWYGPLHSLCREKPIYFDIETIPYKKPVWSIGWGVEGEPIQVIIVNRVPKVQTRMLHNGTEVTLVPDADSAWRFFAQSISKNDAPIFHWTPFDATNLKTEAPSDVRTQLLPRLHDLSRSFDGTVKLPTRGISLKTVGAYLGFSWRGYDDWFAAYTDYQKFLNHHDFKALASACAYQQDDVSAMMIVRRWLVDNAPSETAAD